MQHGLFSAVFMRLWGGDDLIFFKDRMQSVLGDSRKSVALLVLSAT